jgi:mRNA-degrading endonuclease RelE of RelBE toxin-antitoxin system
MTDQDGMRAVGAAVTMLQADPYPLEGFHRGEYHRLRIGPYRIFYVIDDELITIERVDRVVGG